MKSKRTYLTIIAAMVLTIGSIALNGCGNTSNHKNHNHEATEEVHKHDGELAEAQYQCPMKCEGDKIYEEPGNCPVCKMELKEVE